MIRQLDILVEWDFNGTIYRYSRFQTRTIGGHVYQNRILQVSGLSGFYIDRNYADFPALSLVLCNLADDGSTNFPFHALDTIDDFEDKKLDVYIYDVVTNTSYLVWTGISTRPDFDPENFRCTLGGTFAWDAVEIGVPARKIIHLCQERFNGSAYETAGHTVPSIGCPYDPAHGIGIGSFTSCNRTQAECEERGMLQYATMFTHIAPVLKNDPNNIVDREKIRSGVVPVVIGIGDIMVRPEIYRAEITDEGELIVNGLVSGVHDGLPFDGDEVTADRVFFGEVTPATWVKFWEGDSPQNIPNNTSIFKDGLGHSHIAYFGATFSLTKEQIDKYSDDIPFHAIRIVMDGGRKLLRTGAQSESPVLALEDALVDPIFGPGIPTSQFDDTSIVDTRDIIAERFHGRYEWDKGTALIDFVQASLGTWHGYITRSLTTGKYFFGAKTDEETPVATFGEGGYRIDDNGEVDCSEEDFSKLVNDLLVHYRTQMRQKHSFAYADKGAQVKAGNGLEKIVNEEIFLDGIYDDDEAAVSAAIWLREEQNLNLFIEFDTPLDDWLQAGVRCGQLITVISPHIWNNTGETANDTFRVVGWDLDTENFTVHVSCQVYKASVFANNAFPINGDILRGGGETSTWARPPDVENCMAAIVDVFRDTGDPDNTDDDTRMAAIECSWEYPDVSALIAQLNTHSVFPEYPISAVALYWRYTDESVFGMKLGARVNYPDGMATINVPFHKKREVEIWFVAIGRNNGQGQLGYVLDRTRVTVLEEEVDVTEFDIDVEDASVFAAMADGEYIRCGAELMEYVSAASNTITVTSNMGDRIAVLGSEATDHPLGREIGVTKKSHPTVTVDMRVHRHTLPYMLDVTAKRRRDDGIRYRCAHLDYSVVLHKWFYVSLDPNAFGVGADPNDFIAPAWFIADPENPPEAGYTIREGTEGTDPTGTSYFMDDFSGPPCDVGGGSPGFEDGLCSPWVMGGNTPFGLGSVQLDPGPPEVREYIECVGIHNTKSYIDEYGPYPYHPGDFGDAYVNIPSGNSFIFGADIVGGRLNVFDIDNGSTLAGGWQLWFAKPGSASSFIVKLRRGYFPFGPPGFVYTCYVYEQPSTALILRYAYHFNNADWPKKVKIRVTPTPLPGDPDTGQIEVIFSTPDPITGLDIDTVVIGPSPITTSSIVSAAAGSCNVGIRAEFANRDMDGNLVGLHPSTEGEWSGEYDNFFATTLDYDPGVPGVDPVVLAYGIYKVQNHDNRAVLTWEEIVAMGGVEGSVVNCRGAFHHKRNWSPGLSYLAARKHARGPLCAPDPPSDSSLEIQSNEADGSGADVVLRVLHVCPDDFAETADDADVMQVTFNLRRPLEGGGYKKKRKTYTLDDEDAALTYIDAELDFKHGGIEWECRKIVYHNGNKTRASDVGSFFFTTASGGLSLSDLGDVDITAPDDGDVLTWDAGLGEWVASPAGSGYSDEQAQDAVAAMLIDTPTIDFTYTDATPELKADLKDSSVSFAKLLDATAQYRIIGRKSTSGGDFEEVTRDEFFDWVSTTVGAIIARDTSGAWVGIAPSSTVGWVLQSNGTGALPSYGAVTGVISGTFARSSVVATTASLADLAEEAGVVALGKTFDLIKIQADRACRVRLYSTAAGRTADATREPGYPAVDGIGLITDPIFSAAATLICPPGTRGSNCDTPVSTDIYYAIQNRSGSASPVQITFTYLRLE